MKFEVAARAKLKTGTLFSRGVEEGHLAWIKKDAEEKNLGLGEYLNVVIAKLREYSSTKKVSKKRPRASAKKSKQSARTRL